MLNKIVYSLNQPHPGYYSLKAYFRIVLAITVIVFLIIALLQPLNIGQRNIQNNPFLTAAVYAGASAAILSLNAIWFLIFPKWFVQENWTLGKELLVAFYQFFSIAVVIWIIKHFRGVATDESGIGNSFFLAIAIGLLPYLIATFVRHNYLLKQHTKEVAQLNQQLSVDQSTNTEHINSEKLLLIPKLESPVAVSDFLYAESRGNNLLIQSEQNNKPVVYTVRSTLNEFVEANRHFTQLFRCHRSFIINMDRILKVEGNAAGYQVLLHNQLPAVVVARSNVAAFRKKIENNSGA